MVTQTAPPILRLRATLRQRACRPTNSPQHDCFTHSNQPLPFSRVSGDEPILGPDMDHLNDEGSRTLVALGILEPGCIAGDSDEG